MKIAVTGATGFVGSRLIEQLQAQGHTAIALTRNAARGQAMFPQATFPQVTVVEYDPMQLGDWAQALSGCDGVVNLAGEPIAEQRWTESVKASILNSRKVGTENLVAAIAQANPRPAVLVNASAIGYYGTSETATFDEHSQHGDDFLANVCTAWEQAAQQVTATDTRLVILRIGIVLGDGGAIAKMLPPFRMFAGGPIGSGRQWFSWIHRNDLVNLILKGLTDSSMSGVYNATAPNPVRMNELCNRLGEVMNRPSWVPVPDFVLQLLLGDGAQVVLEGQNVMPKRTLDSGFKYEYTTVKPALANIVETAQ